MARKFREDEDTVLALHVYTIAIKSVLLPLAARHDTKNTLVCYHPPLGCTVECLRRGESGAEYSTSSTKLNDLAFNPTTFTNSGA